MKIKLHWQIFIALVLSVIVAVVFRKMGFAQTEYAEFYSAACEFIGKLFMNALKMVVVPLVIASIICGVVGLGSERNFGRMAFKTLSYYVLTTTLAALLGLLVMNVVRPGVVSYETAQGIIGQAQQEDVLSQVGNYEAKDMLSIFIQMVPANVVKAASDNGQLLGIITFSLIFGFFVTRIPEDQKIFQKKFWESVQTVMMRITDMILLFAPLGVFALVSPVIIRTGFDLLGPLLYFILTVFISLAFFMLVILSLFLRFVGRVSPWAHLKAMAPVILTAFSTASSASTLPVTIETVEKDAKVSNRIASFLLPLGATVNMAGTALYECAVVLFIVQVYGVVEGVTFSVTAQLFVVLLSVLTSVGVAGIPSASLVAITVVLSIVGLPLEAVGIIWVSDRILDMLRTIVNVYSDTCGAVIIARSEGERTAYPCSD